MKTDTDKRPEGEWLDMTTVQLEAYVDEDNQAIARGQAPRPGHRGRQKMMIHRRLIEQRSAQFLGRASMPDDQMRLVRYAMRWAIAERAWRIDALQCLRVGSPWASKPTKAMMVAGLDVGTEASMRRALVLVKRASQAESRGDTIIFGQLDRHHQRLLRELLRELGGGEA